MSVLTLLLLSPHGGGATEPKETPPPRAVVPRATGKIVIDGRLDEPDWKRAPRVEPFLRYDGAPWGDVVDARLLWDDQAFYLGVVILDTDVWSDWRHHDDPLWQGDCFEWYLSPFLAGKPYVELEFNPYNALLDIFLTDNPRQGGLSLWDWDAKGIRQAVTVQGTLGKKGAATGWTLEVALPWKALRFAPHVPPKVGDRMRGTLIYYNHPNRDATIEHRQWAPSYDQGWPHHPERFGTFEFAGVGPGASGAGPVPGH
jgi:hypothetical protein